ncbi:MAG: class I SAM-dependent methyltransferase [Acidobacteriota bacterium]
MAKPTDYDRIAKAWHQATGHTGGPLKKYRLNDLLIDAVGPIDGQRLLELGAGNGYFLRLLLRRRSGQRPDRLVISDVSTAMLELAQRHFRVGDAEYERVDLRKSLPFEYSAFDALVASMVLNELRNTHLDRALAECFRVLSPGGRLAATITHPDFIDRLRRNGQLERGSAAGFTMPGKGRLRLPVVPRPLERYLSAFIEAGFTVETEAVEVTDEMVRERPGLRHAASTPLALLFRADKPSAP